MHTENSVRYTFNKSEAIELGYKPFNYDTYSDFKVERPMGELHLCGLDNTVYCRNHEDFLRLIENWSRTLHWKYEESNDPYTYSI